MGLELTLKYGQELYIGDNIVVSVAKFGGPRSPYFKIVINAPREIQIGREQKEMFQKRELAGQVYKRKKK